MPPVRHADPVRDLRLESDVGLLVPTAGAVRGAVAEGVFDTNPTTLLGRKALRAGREVEEFFDYQLGNTDQNPLITADEANQRYGIKGALSFDKPIHASTAAELHLIKQRERARQDILARNDSVGFTEQLAVGALASFTDPINIAATFIPAGWLGRAGFLARGGWASRTAARATAGATEGLVIGTGIEAIVLPLAQAEGQDYTLGDSLATIFFSTALGGVLTPAIGAVGDAISPPKNFAEVRRVVEPEDVAKTYSFDQGAARIAHQGPIDQRAVRVRSAAMAEAISAVADDAPVDVGPVMRRAAADENIRVTDPVTGNEVPIENVLPPAAARTASPNVTAADVPSAALGNDINAPKIGEGDRAAQITSLEQDIAVARQEIDEALTEGRLTEDDLVAARQEVVDEFGAPALTPDEVTAAYDAARLCLRG